MTAVQVVNRNVWRHTKQACVVNNYLCHLIPCFFCMMKNTSMATLWNIFIFPFVDVNKWPIWATRMKFCIRRNRNQRRQMVWYVTDFRDFRGSLVLEGVSGFGDFGIKLFCLVIQGTRDSVVVIVTRLAGRPWRLRNCGSFTRRDSKFPIFRRF